MRGSLGCSSWVCAYVRQAERWQAMASPIGVRPSKGFSDEHLLWLSARLCGLDPGPRMTSATISQERPIHGYHAHSRQLAHPSDRPSVCDVAPPFAKRHLRGLALSRFERSARVVGCTRQVELTRPKPAQARFTSSSAAFRAIVERLQPQQGRIPGSSLCPSSMTVRLNDHGSSDWPRLGTSCPAACELDNQDG